MDVAAFSGDNFDPKEWINKALRTGEPSQLKEEAAASLVMKLQLMIAKLNSALEDQCGAVVQSIPRVIRDAAQLESEAGLLSDKLSQIRAEMEAVEAETRANMSSLVKMDCVKERLAATTRALQEADNWTSLDNQVEEAFDSNDHEAVAEKLVGMGGSLRLLHHVADYQDRVCHLEQHKNRLEATLSPLLITSFTNKDTEAALRLVKMFRTIERHQQLSKYYHKCVRAGLLQKWAEIVGGDGEGAEHWLDTWYAELTVELASNKTWVETVFSDQSSPELMCDLVTDVLASLQPSPQFCVEAAVKLSEDALGLLISVRSQADKFLASIESIVTGAGDKRLRELGKVVYKPFQAHVTKYEELEVKMMGTEVSSWIVEKKDTIDELHSLGNCVTKFSTMIEAAAGRCVAFTRGAAFPGLVAAVSRVLDAHLDRYRKMTRRLEKKKVIVDDDWSVLQHCLTANQMTGELIMMLEHLDISLTSIFLDSSRGYLGQDSSESPLQQHHIFMLEKCEAIMDLNDLHMKVTSNESTSVSLLHQSMNTLTGVCSELQKTTFSVMFHPVSTQMEVIPGLEAWLSLTSGQSSVDTADMPEFSLSPSEYITCVGEYLMTLPQHLEPVMAGDSPALVRALR